MNPVTDMTSRLVRASALAAFAAALLAVPAQAFQQDEEEEGGTTRPTFQRPTIQPEVLRPQTRQEDEEEQEDQAQPRMIDPRFAQPELRPVGPQFELSDQALERFQAIQQDFQAGQLRLLDRQPRFEIAPNPALNFELSELAGTRAPDDLAEQARRQNRLADFLLRIDRDAAEAAMRTRRQPLGEENILAQCNPDARAFDWLHPFEEHAAEIRAELLALKEQRGFQPLKLPNWASKHQKKAADGAGAVSHDAGDWNVFYLFLHEEEYEENCRRCPLTTSLLQAPRNSRARNSRNSVRASL